MKKVAKEAGADKLRRAFKGAKRLLEEAGGALSGDEAGLIDELIEA